PKAPMMLVMTSPTVVLTPVRWLWTIVKRLSESHEAEKRQHREEMMEAADEFAIGVQQAITGVRDALQRPARELADVSVVWKAQPEVMRLVGEAEARLARVGRIFEP